MTRRHRSAVELLFDAFVLAIACTLMAMVLAVYGLGWITVRATKLIARAVKRRRTERSAP